MRKRRKRVEDLPNESWSVVMEHWAISTHGRMKSLERLIERSDGPSYIKAERLMAPHHGRPEDEVSGHHISYRLQVDLERHCLSAYKLMWEAFRDEPLPDGHLACVGELHYTNLRPLVGLPHSHVLKAAAA